MEPSQNFYNNINQRYLQSAGIPNNWTKQLMNNNTIFTKYFNNNKLFQNNIQKKSIFLVRGKQKLII